MRIAFIGLPLAALLLHADGHDLVYAGICRRGAIGTRRLRRRIGDERVQIVPNLATSAVADRIRAARPDLLVSWFWTKRVPGDVLAIPPLGAFGVHPSLLPRHRGPDPCYWAIWSGDCETGVTAHRLDVEYDTGGVLGQRRIAIDDAWNSWTLAKQLDRPSLALLRETARAFATGVAPTAVAQDPAEVTQAPAPTEDDLRLDFRAMSGDDIVRKVRAAAPFPGAWVEIEDDVVVITGAQRTQDVPLALLPGETAVVNGRAVVRAKDAGVALLHGRLVQGDEEDSEIELSEEALAARVARLSRGVALA